MSPKHVVTEKNTSILENIRRRPPNITKISWTSDHLPSISNLLMINLWPQRRLLLFLTRITIAFYPKMSSFHSWKNGQRRSIRNCPWKAKSLLILLSNTLMTTMMESLTLVRCTTPCTISLISSVRSLIRQRISTPSFERSRLFMEPSLNLYIVTIQTIHWVDISNKKNQNFTLF